MIDVEGAEDRVLLSEGRLPSPLPSAIFIETANFKPSRTSGVSFIHDGPRLLARMHGLLRDEGYELTRWWPPNVDSFKLDELWLLRKVVDARPSRLRPRYLGHLNGSAVHESCR